MMLVMDLKNWLEDQINDTKKSLDNVCQSFNYGIWLSYNNQIRAYKHVLEHITKFGKD